MALAAVSDTSPGAGVTLLDRYLARQVLVYTGLVMAVFVVLAALFVFIDQQSDIGKGHFGMLDAIAVTALLLPSQAFQLLPVAALIGALLGLGNLARGSELIVVRATGGSVFRVARAAAAAGVLMLAVALLFGEFLAPPLEAYANQVKTTGKYSDFGYAGGGHVWLKEDNRMISIDRQSSSTRYGGVRIYELSADANGQQHLAMAAVADRAEVTTPSQWRLHGYAMTRPAETPVVASTTTLYDWPIAINPEFLAVATVDPDTLPLRAVYRYIHHLKHNDLETHGWEVSFWSRIARSLATVVLCMFAVPFVFGPLRSSGAGSRSLIGILVGVVYFLINRTLENSGQVYGLSPLVIAWAPFVVLTTITLVAIRRTR
jgi:lipopolysaccharide export system permease protein